MRKRLIEIVKKSLVKNIDYTHKLAENITDDLLANGVFVPPCKVGDKIYFVCGYNMAEYEVYKMEYDCLFWRIYCQNNAYVIEHREFVFFDERIGKTVFLTKEEAEKALERMNDHGTKNH